MTLISADSNGSVPLARGLICGGGGVVGLAWQIGVLLGLVENGIDLPSADEIIGTSAGAFAATALLDERGIRWAYQRQLDMAVEEIASEMPPDLFATIARILSTSGDDDSHAGRLLGHYAREASTICADARLRVVRDRLARSEWPSDRLRMTAVDTKSGKLQLLDRASGIPLDVAAAASGAAPGMWPVVSYGEHSWIDGGSVSVTNAQFARRFRRCVVISPMAANLSGVTVEAELDAAAPGRFALVTPDGPCREVIGSNPFAPELRPSAASEGLRQGRAITERVAAIWNRA